MDIIRGEGIRTDILLLFLPLLSVTLMYCAVQYRRPSYASLLISQSQWQRQRADADRGPVAGQCLKQAICPSLSVCCLREGSVLQVDRSRGGRRKGRNERLCGVGWLLLLVVVVVMVMGGVRSVVSLSFSHTLSLVKSEVDAETEKMAAARNGSPKVELPKCQISGA